MSVCLFPINVKTAAPIWPKFMCGMCGTQERFVDAQNYKNAKRLNNN